MVVHCHLATDRNTDLNNRTPNERRMSLPLVLVDPVGFEPTNCGSKETFSGRKFRSTTSGDLPEKRRPEEPRRTLVDHHPSARDRKRTVIGRASRCLSLPVQTWQCPESGHPGGYRRKILPRTPDTPFYRWPGTRRPRSRIPGWLCLLAGKG